MKKNRFVLLSFIVSSILILTNCSSGSSSKDNNGTSEKEEVEKADEKEEVEKAVESMIAVTDEFLKFCDEFYNDEDYNPAKFKVKQEEFKDEWIVLSGEISNIFESGDISIEVSHYHYNRSSYTTGIKASYNFGSPEKVMNLKIGQEIKIMGMYEHVDKSFYYYVFHFENPQIIE